MPKPQRGQAASLVGIGSILAAGERDDVILKSAAMKDLLRISGGGQILRSAQDDWRMSIHRNPPHSALNR